MLHSPLFAVLFATGNLLSAAAPQYCQCKDPDPGQDGQCRNTTCRKQIQPCVHSHENGGPPIQAPLIHCNLCNGWWSEFCKCSTPKPTGSAQCGRCGHTIKFCIHPHENGGPPIQAPLVHCDFCNGWWNKKKGKKHLQIYCKCSPPKATGGAQCGRCGHTIKFCIHPHENGGPPTQEPLIHCDFCNGWWSEKKEEEKPKETICKCRMPSPDGTAVCTVCKLPIQVCQHHPKTPPIQQPLDRCEICDGWWRYGYCECESPSFSLKDNSVWCSRCELQVKVCSCFGSSLPKIGGKNEQCSNCSGWKEKRSGVYIWIIVIWYRIQHFFCSYILADWFYFFRYFLTSYHLHCSNPNSMTAREVFIKLLDSACQGTYSASSEREEMAAKNLYAWSFVGMRFAFFVGNPVGEDAKYEYCPFAIRYPFLSRTQVIALPKDPAACAQYFRTEIMTKREDPIGPQWDQDFTYFPEPRDELSAAAEKFALEFRQAVHDKDLKKIQSMTVPGSPACNMSIDALRSRLPLDSCQGRSCSPWSDVRLVPFMVIINNKAQSPRVVVERIFGKLYITEIL